MGRRRFIVSSTVTFHNRMVRKPVFYAMQDVVIIYGKVL